MFDRLRDVNWAKAFEYAGEHLVMSEDERQQSLNDEYAIIFGADGDANVVPVEGDADVSTGPFSRACVTEVVAVSEGERDEADWIGVFRLRDGRYAFLEAWCDYTGWDCRASGTAYVSTSIERLLQFGISEEHLERLGLSRAGATEGQ